MAKISGMAGAFSGGGGAQAGPPGRTPASGDWPLMYAAVAVVMHAVVSVGGALIIAPYALEPIADREALAKLCVASAAISGIGFLATASYLTKRIRTRSGVLVGLLCGVLCIAIIGLAMAGIDYSLILYLAILAPTLLAVLLASLVDRSKSGWQ